MRNAPLIGLLGKKRSGKDTFARALIDHHDYTRVAFADALRAVAAELNPILHTEQPTSHSETWRLSDELERYGWETAKDLPEVRRLLQELGNGIRTHVDSTAWFTPVYRQLTSPGVGPVVVTDVRYPNEAELIRSLGGKLVRITRKAAGGDDAHISETALDHWHADYNVANDGDLDSLTRQAVGIHHHMQPALAGVLI